MALETESQRGNQQIPKVWEVGRYVDCEIYSLSCNHSRRGGSSITAQVNILLDYTGMSEVK